MEALFAALEGTALAQALRGSRWVYAAVNTAHIFAIALLIGSVVPLNLRLLGVWRGISREAVVRVLAPVAASGLTLALLTGPLLFSVRAREYSGVGFLQLKLTFIAVGVLSTLALCRAHGFLLKDDPRAPGRSCHPLNGLLAGSTRLWAIDRVRGGLSSLSFGQHERPCSMQASKRRPTIRAGERIHGISVRQSPDGQTSPVAPPSALLSDSACLARL